MNKEKITADKILDDFSFVVCPLECGEGWFELIYNLCKDIKDVLDSDCEFAKDFIVMQIKEKWGLLEFYPSFTTEKIDDLITEVHDKSEYTCEICGSEKGILRVNGYICNYCDDCYNKYKEDSNA